MSKLIAAMTLIAISAATMAALQGPARSTKETAAQNIRSNALVSGVDWLRSVQNPDGSFGDGSYLPKLITTAYATGNLAACTEVSLTHRIEFCAWSSDYILKSVQPDKSLSWPGDRHPLQSTSACLLALAAIRDYVTCPGSRRIDDILVEIASPEQLHGLYRLGVPLPQWPCGEISNYTASILGSTCIQEDLGKGMYARLMRALRLHRIQDERSWRDAAALESVIESLQQSDGSWIAEGEDSLDSRILETTLALRALSLLQAKIGRTNP